MSEWLLWIFLVLMTGFFLKKSRASTLVFCTEEDSDIKIAHPFEEKIFDDGELAAREFNKEKQNGNIEKAYELGQRLAALLFAADACLAVQGTKKQAEDPFICRNAQVLFAFIVDTVLEHGCPNSVAAQTALNFFHKKIQERSPETYMAIVESSAFSLYLLCSRDRCMSASCIGNAFAESCNAPQDSKMVKLGDDLYQVYLELCRLELAKTKFVHE